MKQQQLVTKCALNTKLNQEILFHSQVGAEVVRISNFYFQILTFEKLVVGW